MASLTYKSGRGTIQHKDRDGERRTVRLGVVTKKTAQAIRLRINYLEQALLSATSIDPATAEWVASIGDELHAKLAKTGLIVARENKEKAILGPFLTSYIESRTDLKPLTIRHLNDARRNLVAFFGEDKPLADVTPGDADEFRRDLLTRLGDNTVRRQCGRAKQFFRFATRKRLIQESPFADMKDCGVRANRSREYFVTHKQIEQVIDVEPDPEWKLIIALARYGGLRTPSETLALTWDCVLWEQEKIRVPSPKTAHHEGHDERIIPMFGELKPYLEAVFDAAPEGSTHVITRYRNDDDKKPNLIPQFRRLIRRSGQECWPKSFQNCRSSRQTELEQRFPSYVVCAWMGNSQTIARRHYLQVRPEHFAQATDGSVQALHEALRKEPEQGGMNRVTLNGEDSLFPSIPSDSAGFSPIQCTKLPPQGLEP